MHLITLHHAKIDGVPVAYCSDELMDWLEARPNGKIAGLAEIASRAVDTSENDEPRGFWYAAPVEDGPESQVCFERATLADPWTAFFPSER